MLTRPKILGAWPFWDIPNIALEAVNTKEFVVEKIDTKIRALISEGRNGIWSRFIAISLALACQDEGDVQMMYGDLAAPGAPFAIAPRRFGSSEADTIPTQRAPVR